MKELSKVKFILGGILLGGFILSFVLYAFIGNWIWLIWGILVLIFIFGSGLPFKIWLTKKIIENREIINRQTYSEKKNMGRDEHDEEDFFGENEEKFPWDDVIACRKNKKSPETKETEEEIRKELEGKVNPCPKCGKTLKEMEIFYFKSPDWTWKDFVGVRVG